MTPTPPIFWIFFFFFGGGAAVGFSSRPNLGGTGGGRWTAGARISVEKKAVCAKQSDLAGGPELARFRSVIPSTLISRRGSPLSLSDLIFCSSCFYSLNETWRLWCCLATGSLLGSFTLCHLARTILVLLLYYIHLSFLCLRLCLWLITRPLRGSPTI